MNTSNKIIDKRATDPIDRLIFDGRLRIKTLWFDQDLDLLVVLLNNKKIIKRPISDFSRLKSASKTQLDNFENDGIGIYWPDIDEDLSLRGFLKYELAHFTEKVA